jgi:NADH-quinone oxidoreductase subunit M
MGWLLLLTIFLPLAAAGLVALIGSSQPDSVRTVALGSSLVTLGLSLYLAACYVPPENRTRPIEPTMTLTADWGKLAVGTSESAPKLKLELGIDGIGVWMFVLTSLLMISSILISWESVTDRVAEFHALLLMLQTAMLGVFCAFDVILFYVFFEFTLIPLFFLIGIWGGPDKIHAARKFFIYTLAGSVITLVGALALCLTISSYAGKPTTFSIPELAALVASESKMWPVDQWRAIQGALFLALFAGFAIKVPLFPFHTWLPLAHVEAPTAGSVLLAGILLKLGTLGFLRLAVPMLPDACISLGFPLIAWLSVIGIIYGALCSLAQTDVKKRIAYSSVSHLGFCMLGLAAFNTEGLSGSVMQMINHGLSTGALFLIFGCIYDRYHTREMAELKGLAGKLPLISTLMVLACMSSVGLPMLNGFIGEFLCLAGMFKVSPGHTALATIGVVLGAWYLLDLLRRSFFGPVGDGMDDPHHHAHDDHGHGGHAQGHHGHHDDHVHGAAPDLKWREFWAIAPISVLFLVIGFFPETCMKAIRPDCEALAKPYVGAKFPGVLKISAPAPEKHQ